MRDRFTDDQPGIPHSEGHNCRLQVKVKDHKNAPDKTFGSLNTRDMV